MCFTLFIRVFIIVLTSLGMKPKSSKDVNIEQAYNAFDTGAELKSEIHAGLVDATKQQQLGIIKS